MKTLQNSNPEQSIQTIINLPQIKNLGSYQIYELEKRSRKGIQNKRKMLQQSVSALKRQAQETIKNFCSIQDDLMYTYNKKLSTLESTNKKIQAQRRNRQQLEKKKNYSSLTRYLHQVKKQSATQEILDRKKQKIQQLKEYLQNALSKKQKNQKQLYATITQRNKRMGQTNRSKAKWARQKSLEQKRKLSKNVRDQLIQLQQNLKQKQAQRIKKLENEKNFIIQLLQKNKQKQKQVQQLKQQLSGMSLYDFQSRVVGNKNQSRISVLTRKLSRSKKKKTRQSSLYI